jgi:hypothetical protein
MFRRPVMLSDKIKKFMFCLGEHIHCEIFVPDMRCGNDVGFSFTNFSGDTMQLRSDIKYSYKNLPDCYSCLRVLVNQNEYNRFMSHNLTLVQRRISYNYSDCIFTLLPTTITDVFVKDQQCNTNADVPDTDILENVTSLFCAQSIIMTLRASLENDHKLHRSIHNITARCTSPQTLFSVIQNVVGDTTDMNVIVQNVY